MPPLWGQTLRGRPLMQVHPMQNRKQARHRRMQSPTQMCELPATTHIQHDGLPRVPQVQCTSLCPLTHHLQLQPHNGRMNPQPLTFLQLNVARSNIRMHILLNTLTSHHILILQEPWVGRIGVHRSSTNPSSDNILGTVSNPAWECFMPDAGPGKLLP